MFIYIIRHGETDLNSKGIMQGWIDEPLNESGRFLAEETGRAMRAQGIRFDGCYSSPLIRAKETAEIVLRESGNPVDILCDDRIREIHFGDYDGKALERDKQEAFFLHPFEFGRFPGGECVQDVCRRTQNFLKELIARDDDRTYLVSGHGCAMRAMLNWLYDDPSDYWHGHVPYNCAVNIIEAHGGKAKLIADDRIYYDPKYCVDLYAVK